MVTATLVFTLSQAQFLSKHFSKSAVVGAVTFLVTAILVFTLSQAQFFYNTKGPLTLLIFFFLHSITFYTALVPPSLNKGKVWT